MADSLLFNPLRLLQALVLVFFTEILAAVPSFEVLALAYRPLLRRIIDPILLQSQNPRLFLVHLRPVLQISPLRRYPFCLNLNYSKNTTREQQKMCAHRGARTPDH